MAAAPSFAAVVAGHSTPPITITPKVVTRHKGIPLVPFLDSEIDALAAPFRYSLVGTFWYGRPPLKVIRDVFEKIGFHHDLRITLIDQSHILLNFRNEADYLRCFYRRSWHISGCHMRVTKWTVDFDPSSDAPIVPVWVALPGLPVHFHQQEALFEIVRAIGLPIKLDIATSQGLRPSVARVCVELDVSQDLPQKLYLQAKGRLILQNIVYEDLPLFCKDCRRLGHASGNCSSTTAFPIPPPPPPPPISRPAKTRWTPVKRKSTAPPPAQDGAVEDTLMDPPSSEDIPVYDNAQQPSEPGVASAPTIPTPSGTDPMPNLTTSLPSAPPSKPPSHEEFSDAADFPATEEAAQLDFGHVSDNDLPADSAVQEIPMVSADVAHRMQLMQPSLNDELLISRLQDPTSDGPFIPVVPRRKRRSRKDLPPLPPSTVLTRSASHIIQGSVSTLTQ